MIKITANLLRISTLFAAIIFALLVVYIHLPLVFLANKTCVYLHPAENFNEFIRDMTEKQKAKHISPLIVKIYARLNHVDHHLEAGEYCFIRYDSIASMLGKIARGEREHHEFTIVDGWRYQDLLHHLALAPSFYNSAQLNNNADIIAALKIPENNLEGQFYPETYDYAYPDTPIDILRQAHNLMQQKITTLYSEVQSNTIFKNSYELLIAASIIQKEASNPEDQTLVASVLINRLKLNMKLQMDPTVIYGLEKNRYATLTKSDLKIDSPYNTYLHTGLPPTPICMPGETALYAAAHPQETKYLYFVSKKNGVHQFSETLAEQTNAINKYLLHQENEK